MRFSRLVSVLLVAAWGCGHSSAARPAPPAPASRGSGAYGGAPRRVHPASVAPSSPLALDPSEAITSRELATIPDPVPDEGGTRPDHVATKKAAGADSEITAERPTADPSTSTQGKPPPGAAAGDERRWIWRVQVFASPDLELAGRIAKEASVRFGEPSVIEFEDALYKVRLGAFASEALAQSLRERAVQGGFPGAFRMRSVEVANYYSK